MASVLDQLTARLREVGALHWEAVADAAGVAKSLPRKLVYGDRENPGVKTIQPLIDLFAEVDAGRRPMPSAKPAEEARDAA